MNKAIKAFTIVFIALIVFLGGLLIVQGANAPEAPAAAPTPIETSTPAPAELFDSQEGSAA